MKSVMLWAAVVVAASLVSAIDLAPRSANPRVVTLDIQRRDLPNVAARDGPQKRQKTVQQILNNEVLLYYANLTLGTPPQSLQLHIDTGSSDLWVNLVNSTICATRKRCIGGAYDIAASSSVKFVNANFNITYVDGSAALGNYVTDTMTFGGAQLQNFQFGTGLTSSSRQGVLGIGYTANEALVVKGKGSAYPNLPQALVDSGNINRNAYSLWLNDLDASTGSILFGGIDTAKYQGNLVTVPIYGTRAYGFTQFIVAMTSFGLNGSAVASSNFPFGVVLDSGSTLTRLPDDIVLLLYQTLDIQYDRTTGEYLGYCDLANTNSYLEFGFSGINIQVPFNELWLDLATDLSGTSLTRNGRKLCYFGIQPAEGIIPILGDTFLRSAYVVYDLERDEVSLAQTIFNSTNRDIRELASGTAQIPNASLAPLTISTLRQPTATVGARLGSVTGSYTVSGGSPQQTGGVRTTTVTASRSASSNAAYPTKAPYLVGAAVMAGAGLLL